MLIMAKKQYHVQVFEKLCKACRICIALCPAKVYKATPEGKASVANEDACVGCLMCEMHCPDFCVEVEAKEDA